MSVAHLYDFATQMEDAVAALFTAQELTVSTPRTSAQFQKERPRWDILFQQGQAKQSYHVVNGKKRNASWMGQLILEAITSSGDGQDATSIHRAYVAQARFIMSTAIGDLNESDADPAPLPYHEIQNIVEQGSTPEYKPEDGYMRSKLIYAVEYGVVKAAWTELTT